MKAFYTLQEAAEKLNIEEQWVRFLAARGRLTEFGDFNNWKYRRQSVDDLAARPSSYLDLVPLQETVRTKPIRRALYIGSFNPPTNGHTWVIEKFAPLFDELIVAVGVNPSKSEGAFSVAERIEMLEQLVKPLGNVQVVNAGLELSANLAVELGCNYFLQGVRSLGDYEYQKAARYANEDIAPGVETLLVIPPRHLVEISSSFVVGLIRYNRGEEQVAKMVSPLVLEKLKQKQRKDV